MKLVVGLGNPGKEYAGTRHNIGFELVERFASQMKWIAKESEFDRLAKNKFDALVLDGSVGPEKVLLVKPLTFMNLSGKSVLGAMGFYQLTPPDVMVVLDDIALPSGRIRLRESGSSGGHNGLKDIERVLGTNAYPRLRIGIDSPGRIPQRDYVLGRINEDQRRQIDPAVDRGIEAIKMWIEQGISKAMSKFNAEEKKD